MTQLKAFELEKEKMYVLFTQRYCPVCGRDMINSRCQPQWAHRIPEAKMYLKKYGPEVIHHRLNMVLVCSLRCNSAVLLNPASRPVAAAELVKKIREDLEK